MLRDFSGNHWSSRNVGCQSSNTLLEDALVVLHPMNRSLSEPFRAFQDGSCAQPTSAHAGEAGAPIMQPLEKAH